MSIKDLASNIQYYYRLIATTSTDGTLVKALMSTAMLINPVSLGTFAQL